MSTNLPRTPLVIGVSLAVLTAIVALSVALVAGWSTTAVLFVMSVGPVAVALLVAFGGRRSMTTHELLYAVENSQERRR